MYKNWKDLPSWRKDRRKHSWCKKVQQAGEKVRLWCTCTWPITIEKISLIEFESVLKSDQVVASRCNLSEHVDHIVKNNLLWGCGSYCWTVCNKPDHTMCWSNCGRAYIWSYCHFPPHRYCLAGNLTSDHVDHIVRNGPYQTMLIILISPSYIS